MKYTKKVLSVLMALMMGFTVMTTPILAESPSDQESAGEPEVTETEKQDTEEVTEAPEEETEETETPEVSEEPVKEPEVAEGQEETDQPADAPEAEEKTEKTEEQETVEGEQEEEEQDTVEEEQVTTVSPAPVTYDGVTVTVSYLSDAFGGKNVTLVVDGAGETEKEALDKLGRAYKAVDISFVDEEGNKAQPIEGNQVDVLLEAKGVKAAGNFGVFHVGSDGEISSVVNAKKETTEEVTEKVKVGETTKTVTVPAETKIVTVNDYKEETYTDYESQTKTVEVPAEIGYRYVLKSRQVQVKQATSPITSLFSSLSKNKTKTVTEYYLEKEEYVIKPAYTKTVTEKVPVTKTKKVLVGTHEETEIIKEAYSYEVKENVYEDVTISNVSSSFKAGSFSTYALVWNDGAETATIKWGYMVGDVFTEIEESEVTLDETASSMSILNSYEGYLYAGAVYVASGGDISEDGVNINTTLKKTDSGWSCDVINTEEGTETATSIANGSVIYVTYIKPGTPTPSGSGDATIPSPTTEKTVTDNGDGTFTIQLDITGAKVTEDNSHYVNVLIILDATRSMNGTKWTNAKAAMKALIETMTEGENAQNAGKIDFALVTFGRSATVVQNWTKDNAAFKTKCAGINMVTTSGTNWEAGMRGGLYGVLNSYPEGETEAKHDPTYVIFLTDGDPNVYYSSGADTNYTNSGTTNGYNQNANTSANHSADEAKSIAAKTKLYGIYCGDSGTQPSGESYNRLVGVITGQGQGGQKTIAANADTIESEFKAIAETALKDIGVNNASVDDGVPSLAGISANVTGQAGGYEYYKKEPDETEFTKWDEAPGALYSEDNGVTWNLSSVGTLPAETTYRIKFTVWPSQEAYDLIADLNNGLKEYDDLPQEQKDAVTGNKEDGYTLVTNTHLNTSYTFKDQTYSDKPENLQYGSMPLPTKTVSVVKEWPENMVDSYGAAVYRDPETGETKTATEIDLKLQKDSADYLDIKVESSKGWRKDDIYISSGNMTVVNDVVTIHEPGHDYQIVEPPQFMYYWDLISDVYHPMVINGVNTLLVYDVDATSEDVDNETYFAIGENKDGTPRIYKKHADNDNVLKASNYRRSNLNLTKQIIDIDGETPVTDENAEFVYKAKVTDSNSSDGKIWFSALDPTASAFVTDDEWVTGTGVEAEIGIDGNPTGYYSAPNGTELTMTIKAGWNVRFLNVYHDSTFSFEETGMPGNYEYKNVTAKTENEFIHTSSAEWYKVAQGSENGKIEGKITEPNNNYTVTYTNCPKPEFYIYHSGVNGDGNLETIPMRYVKSDGTFNLLEELKDGDKIIYSGLTSNTLYGGYYLSYEGKGDYKDDGVKGTTGVKYTGMNYQNWADCEPQTVKGTEMKPKAGETYYIKEVPTYYLRNYHQLNYVKSTGKLTALYLISAIDDLNYTESGFTLQGNDGQKAKIVSKMDFYSVAANKTITLKANSVFASLGITGNGSESEYLTYWNATDSEYFATGTFTILPYWETLDGITVNGISTRTITISSMTKAGVKKSDN